VQFTVTFPASGPPASVDELGGWLTARGEAFVVEDGLLALRALPLRFATARRKALEAVVEVNESVPLSRLVDVLFEISVRAGSDVNLVGHGPIGRAELWLRLADEQDRLRIAAALERARIHNQHDDIHHRLWAVVASLRPDHDDRWDTREQRIVELEDTGKEGEAVPVPITAQGLHCLTWRWLSEAYPGITDPGRRP
jgi:hypothetical protein